MRCWRSVPSRATVQPRSNQSQAPTRLFCWHKGHWSNMQVFGCRRSWRPILHPRIRCCFSPLTAGCRSHYPRGVIGHRDRKWSSRPDSVGIDGRPHCRIVKEFSANRQVRADRTARIEPAHVESSHNRSQSPTEHNRKRCLELQSGAAVFRRSTCHGIHSVSR